MIKYKILILTSIGLEKTCIKEIQSYDIKNIKIIRKGMLQTEINLNYIYDLLLKIKTAERIYILLSEFKALSFDELYNELYKINWKDYIYSDNNIIIDKVRSNNSKLYSLRDIQSVSQKAIFNKIMDSYSIKKLSLKNEIIKIRIYINNNQVFVALDICGNPLHKRNYRKYISVAPLKETIASGIVHLSNWDSNSILIDPFCGSGTILIEALLKELNYPVNSNRKLDLEKLKIHQNDLYIKRKKTYLENIDFDKKFNIYGFDIDINNIDTAIRNYNTLSFSSKNKYISFKVSDFKNLNNHYSKKGYIITNPPFGERIGNKESSELIYKNFNKLINEFNKWNIFVFSSHKNLERFIKRKCLNKHFIQNGKISTYLYHF